jgi:GTP-binding protein HflX
MPPLEIPRLVLISLESETSARDLAELAELAKTSGAEAAGQMTQRRGYPDPNTYFGSGKVSELKDYVELLNADGIVCDDELSPRQIKNLSDALDVKIMDRTILILDIFARRALSAEGKAQVELAQLKYNASRLKGLGESLSRQGGTASVGIGSRGPGEKKLELDRRRVREKIKSLENDIKKIKKERAVRRERRLKTGLPLICAVGYTNSGKSTLTNCLTRAGVLAENMLFATLDTTTRKLFLPEKGEALFSDSVGFIQKLPHTLIEAFNATLEELKYADILLHVADVSNPSYVSQIETVYKTLDELKCGDKKIITVLNKMDLIGDGLEIIYRDRRALETLKISALKEINIPPLLETISKHLD